MNKHLLLALAFVGFAAQSQAQEPVTFKEAPFTYKQIGTNKVEVSQVDKAYASGTPAADYVVPATVENGGVTYTVTAIGEAAFKWKAASSITLPETIDTIRANAFNTFDVETITLPSKVRYIGDYAFSGCKKLTSFVVPESVEEIGNGAFFTCSNLTSIQLPSKLKKIGTSVFYNCGLTSITWPATLTTIPYSTFQACKKLETVNIQSDLTMVDKMAFLKCAALKSISLPSTVDSIGYEAFCNTGLESFTLPKSATKLGSEFIANAPITAFKVEEGNTHFAVYDGAIYSADKRLLWAAPVKGLTSFKVLDGCLGICGGAFSKCEATEITLPNSLVAIDSFGFCEAKVEKINFPAGLKLIGVQGFAGTNLTDVTLPEACTVVYEATFALCPKLKTVTLPKTLTDIAIRAFLNCTALEKITCLGETSPKLEDAYEEYEKQFYGVPSTCELYVPQGATQSYKDAGWDQYFNTIKELEAEVKPTVMTVVKTTPADGFVTKEKFFNMTFDIEFDEDFDVLKKKPAAKLRQGDATTGKVITPDKDWNASRPKAKHLNLWGADWDDYLCYFITKDNTDYYLTIPADILKGKTSGLKNGEIVIHFSVQYATGINDVDATATVTGVYDLSGRKVSGVGIKGIVVKKLSNGKTVKVLQK